MDIQGALKAGYSHDEIIEELGKRTGMDYKGAMEAGYSKGAVFAELMRREKARSEEGPGLGQRIMSGIQQSLNERGQKVNEYAARQFGENLKAPVEKSLLGDRQFVNPTIGDFAYKNYVEAPIATGTMYAGQLAGAVNDIIGTTVSETIGAVMPESVKSFAAEKMQNILKSKWGTTALQKYSQGKEVYDKWAENNPDAADEVNSLVNVVGLTGLKKFSDITGKKFLGEKGWKKLTEPFTNVTDAKKMELKIDADELIDNSIMKGIKPSAQKKKSFQFIERSKENYRGAVKSILKRQDDLPETVLEMSEALADTKRQIWDDVVKISGEASDQGFMVDIKPVIAKMESMAKSFHNVNPNEEARLLELANRWKTGKGWKTITADKKIPIADAEELVSQFNSSSATFFNDLNPNSIKSSINDAGIANSLREELFKSIPKKTKYKQLRKEYGDILNIEKEVTHRAIVAGRANAKGFFDLADIWGTGDFVSGLATLTPENIIKGLVMKTGTKVAKEMNKPDNYIKKMFKGVDKKLVKAGELDPRNQFITRRNSGVDMMGESDL